jgi:hypothetical protein
MKCSVLQRQLLELERPDHPPVELLTHLARCPACRAWQRHLLQLESEVRQLPVPASTTRDDFIRRLLVGTQHEMPPVQALAPPDLPLPERGTLPIRPLRTTLGRRERGVRKLALATGLAAGLLLFVLGWTALLMPPKPSDTRQANKPAAVPDPLLEALVKHNLRLAATAKPRERVETLAALAAELHGEMRSLAHAENSTPEDLKALAALYAKAVRQGVLKQAARLPDDQRQQVLRPIADRLSREANEAEQLAAEVGADRAEAIKSMAEAARDVKEKLLALT